MLVTTATFCRRVILMYFHQAFNHLEGICILLSDNLREKFARSHAHCGSLAFKGTLDLLFHSYPDTALAHCVIHNNPHSHSQRKSMTALMIRQHFRTNKKIIE